MMRWIMSDTAQGWRERRKLWDTSTLPRSTPESKVTGEVGNRMWAVWRVKEEGEAYRRVPVWAVVAVVHPSRWGWLEASGIDRAGMVLWWILCGCCRRVKAGNGGQETGTGC